MFAFSLALKTLSIAGRSSPHTSFAMEVLQEKKKYLESPQESSFVYWLVGIVDIFHRSYMLFALPSFFVLFCFVLLATNTFNGC